MDPLRSTLLQLAQPLYAQVTDPAHSWDHIQRVLTWAEKIALEETKRGHGPHPHVLCAAVLFHDCIKLSPTPGQRDISAQESAGCAALLLGRCRDFPESLIPAVAQAIAQHSLSLGITPTTPESAILQDADRLDSMGPIGVMRVLAHAGAHGLALFSPEDPFCDHRPPQPHKYAFDWSPHRLDKLSASLNTLTARQFGKDLLTQQSLLRTLLMRGISASIAQGQDATGTAQLLYSFHQQPA